MPELTIHDWMEIIAAVFAGGGFYQAMKNLTSKVSKIEADLIKLNDVVMQVALNKKDQDNFASAMLERFKRIEETVRDIQHGRNLIRPD